MRHTLCRSSAWKKFKASACAMDGWMAFVSYIKLGGNGSPQRKCQETRLFLSRLSTPSVAA